MCESKLPEVAKMAKTNNQARNNQWRSATDKRAAEELVNSAMREQNDCCDKNKADNTIREQEPQTKWLRGVMLLLMLLRKTKCK